MMHAGINRSSSLMLIKRNYGDLPARYGVNAKVLMSPS